MRVLIVTPRVPWPPTDGGRIAMARLAESIAAAGATVEVLSLNPVKQYVADPRAPVPLATVDIDTSRVVVPALHPGKERVPYIVERFFSSDFADALRATLARFDPDVVQLESPFLLPYVPFIREESRAHIALRSLNVEFSIWDLLARNEKNFFKRFGLRRVASSLRRYEVAHLDTPDALVPISSSDAAEFRRLGRTRPVYVAPCSVVLHPLREVAEVEGTVGFIGSLDFRPNQEAVEWITGKLWPRVLAAAPHAQLAIAGAGAPERLAARIRGRNVRFLGRVDDADAFLQEMSVTIAPLLSGGGMRIKVLDAMALGRPVVATTLGAGGVEVDPQRDIVIADDVDSFAREVVALLGDAARRKSLGEAARAGVASRYDGEAIARGLLQFYATL